MVKIYKTETVVSVAEIDSPTPEQALKYAKAVEGMQHAPGYLVIGTRSTRFSLNEKTVDNPTGPLPGQTDL